VRGEKLDLTELKNLTGGKIRVYKLRLKRPCLPTFTRLKRDYFLKNQRTATIWGRNGYELRL